jgi:hypothetical protein
VAGELVKQQVIEVHKFEMITDRVTPRLTILPFGKTKNGKTWFALSSPGDLGIISNDTNTKQIAQKYVGLHPGKKIHFAEFNKSPLSQIDDINELKKFWANYRESYYKMLSIKSVRTLIVDTHTIQWDDCKLAYVGKDKPDPSSEIDPKTGKPTGTRIGTQRTIQRDLGEPKREIREMINAIGDKNLILIAQGEDEYKDGPDGKGFRTGRIKPKGMPGVEYLSQCEIFMFRDEKTGTFVARMMSSTANSSIRGREGAMVFNSKLGQDIWESSPDELTNEDINFAMVGVTVFPQTELADWE